MNVYRPPVINALLHFYGDLLYPTSEISIHQHLNLLSIKMLDGLKLKEDCLYTEINNYNPDFLGHPKSVLKNRDFNLDECRHTISHEYGFKSWEEVIKLEKNHYNLEFEQCVNAIVNGKINILKEILETKPSLIHAQSQYGHRATLLHYTASNGIELWRQQVPQNLPDIVNLLIQFGADKNAKMKVYGSDFTTLELLSTSAHPHAAGLAQPLVDILN